MIPKKVNVTTDHQYNKEELKMVWTSSKNEPEWPVSIGKEETVESFKT